jgi:NAD(P)-dependent dehydrogenase (short-subunit alcohol dehydrogenase family)
MEGFAINVFGPIKVTHAFLPLLRAAEHPRIVNVSSRAGSFQRILEPGTVENAVMLPVYPATKAALTMLTVQYARALDGILMNAADPGFTGTDFNNHRGTQTVTEGTDAIVHLANARPLFDAQSLCVTVPRSDAPPKPHAEGCSWADSPHEKQSHRTAFEQASRCAARDSNPEPADSEWTAARLRALCLHQRLRNLPGTHTMHGDAACVRSTSRSTAIPGKARAICHSK